MHPHTTISLLALPPELLDQICSFIDYPDIASVRLTCKKALRHVPPKSLLTKRKEYAGLLFSQEKSRSYRLRNVRDVEVLPCYVCLKLKHRDHFAESQTIKRRCFGHSDAMKRFCIDCGIKRQLWDLKCFPSDVKLCVSCKCLKHISLFIRLASGERAEFQCESCRSTSGPSLCRDPMLEFGGSVVDRVAGVQNTPALRASASASHCSSALVNSGTRDPQAQANGARDVQATTKERLGRCQRCWTIDHTERPIAVVTSSGRPLCRECVMQQIAV